MTSIPKEPLNKDSSKRNNILLSSTNHQINKNNSSNTNKIPPLSSNLGKSNQIISKDIRLNKLNVNSSLNIPTANNATNASLNDQNPPQKKTIMIISIMKFYTKMKKKMILYLKSLP